MARIALINDNHVQTVIIGSLEFAADNFPALLALELNEGEQAETGWLYTPDAQPRFILDPPDTPQPNWSAFRLGVWQSAGYQAVVGASLSNPLVARNLNLVESLILNSPAPELRLLMLFWERVLAALPTGAEPTAAHISEWNELAGEAAIPIQFQDETGEMLEI